MKKYLTFLLIIMSMFSMAALADTIPSDCFKSVEAFNRCVAQGLIPNELQDILRASVVAMQQEREAVERDKVIESESAKHSLNEFNKRCEGDSLNAEQAKGRMLWALKCIPLMNERIRLEITDKMHKGMYVTFGKPVPGTKDYNRFEYIAPVNRDTACNLPDGYYIMASCVAGCYAPDQKVLFSDGEHEIGTATLEKQSRAITVSADSKLDVLSFKETPVESYIESEKDTWQDLIVIKTLFGRSLEVTPNHPILKTTGEMKVAIDIKVGDLLAVKDGREDTVTQITHKRYFGKVHNLEVKSENLKEKIIVAQGILTGTLFYQNKGTEFLNRLLFRENLAADAIELTKN